MKNFIIILILFTGINLFCNELAWVDEQVEAIKPPRIGIKNTDMSKIKDPFIFFSNKIKANKTKNKKTKRIIYTHTKNTNKKVIRKKSYFSLNAILNQSAMINNKWYKYGDTVNGFKIVKIDRTSVLLKRNKNEILISTKSKSNNLQLKK
jgi:hypothetical protein